MPVYFWVIRQRYSEKRFLFVLSVSVLAKRKLIQCLSALLCNADIPQFKTGSLSKSPLKNTCVPGLNCYSCPGAIAACPLGALQNALAQGRFPFFVGGLLLVFGIVLGRGVCGFLCPFGLIQELLYKIPVPKVRKNALTRTLSSLKYAILALLVIGLPLAFFFIEGYGQPFFCKLLCPAGTLEAGIPLVLLNQAFRDLIGSLFFWKLALLIGMVVLSAVLFRFFCRFLCPLGAIYGLFNRYALLGVQVDEAACTHCGTCAKTCKMDSAMVNDRECIRCGECMQVCPVKAIHSISPCSLTRRRKTR
ncbi:MAG: 4Fe-4S binding protein [Treponema sp.]|nr:4Fe-4S binding protein [Treponema sp.]